MNERIQKITGQVLDELVPETWVALGYDKIKEIQYRTVELIVQECATVIERNLFQGIGWNTSRAVKQHFGIEEPEE